MMRSMYSGVAGLRTHQTKMDVIGNNIANVNTVGFKSSAVHFKDTLYQTTQNAKASNTVTNTGGTAAKQIGLGSNVAAISYDPSATGSMQSTGNQFDLMISGNKFFVVNKSGINYFTKVGAFSKDDAGFLVNETGCIVQGWQVDPETQEIIRDQVSNLRVGGADLETASAEMTSKTYAAGNIDTRDSQLTTEDGVKMSVTIYDNLGYSYVVTFKVTKAETATSTPQAPDYDDSKYNIQLVSIKDSKNVDIRTDGYDVTLEPAVFNMDLDSGAFVTCGEIPTDGSAYPIINNLNLTIVPQDDSKGDVFRTYDKDGNPDITSIEIDMSHIQLYASNNTSSMKMYAGDYRGNYQGLPVGYLSSVSIDGDGLIYGVYDNGVERLFGQIAVAEFVNPASLQSMGDSLYATTKNSGDFDGIGEVVSEGGGSIVQGVLEMSNVDLSTEFTEMIVTQRGFQANSRILTV
ncbi:MAG: flagellar hook-basal body complex protein [Lachnospiraceae bacterium]|nr:flagellar hook-basal body complex protein [Lachnospiraceae bacterium]